MLIMHTTLNFKDFGYFYGKMSIASKQARHLKKACETQAKMLEAMKNEIMDEFADESKLDNTLDLITKLPESSNEQINLISSIQ